ncbi:MAG: hypothetical protein LQ338_005493 [Usnochroma carphineum]|nr:MAG: hypothetical protein LQ338_005493 [Usnochroma carphineum]
MPGRGGGGRNKSGGGGGGKSGGGRPPPSREETVSRAMSYVLRHGAEKENLKLDASGYINCADLLSWPRLRSLHVTFPELRSIVATNSKQRFALIPSPSTTTPPDPPSSTNPSDYLIRATQGHSIAISSENLLTPLSPDDANCPDEVVHGTTEDRWAKIKKSGALKRMGRQHVHFALGVPAPSSSSAKKQIQAMVTDSITTTTGVVALDLNGSAKEKNVKQEVDGEQVISGMRSSADILVWVDLKRSAREGGIKWWKSENGVVLTEGDRKGEVGLEWVRRVERRGTGEVVWRNGGEGKES